MTGDGLNSRESAGTASSESQRRACPPLVYSSSNERDGLIAGACIILGILLVAGLVVMEACGE